MPERPIQIMSVNMNQQSFLTHTLLQNATADILLIQEPWIGTVHTARSDSDPLGTAIPGSTNNNMWECYLPSFTDPDSVRVACYVRYDLACTFSIVNHVTHPMSSVESMVLDFTFEEEVLRIVNVYHRTYDKPHHNLLHLLSSELDPLVPTLLLGDLNTHSPIWSFPYATTSPWAPDLVTWFDDQGLELLNPPRIAMWDSGRDDRRPSVLDLALINEAAAISGQISPLHISFDGSITSDHASLSLLWYPAESIAIAPPPELSGYAIDDLLIDSWLKLFGPIEPPSIHDIPSLITAAQRLHEDIDFASSRVFSKRRFPDPRGVRWWTQDCAAALTMVYSCTGQPKKDAICHLRRTIAKAKRVWAHDFLHHTTSDNLWEAAAWRKGRSIKRIPPLLTSPSHTTDDPKEMCEAFRKRFFVTDRPNVSPFQPDDPKPLPTRDLPPITQSEISDALLLTSNKSAPGMSGINYKLLKWAFKSRPDRFLEIFNAAISYGYHPWKEALVVVIPKPSKPDYSLPKAYRPISLLECCGKLLEKIIAKRILSDAHFFNILPPTQFGSCDYHSAVDAALCLTHYAQAAVKCGMVASVVLFDVQGFFDNINIQRIVHIFRNLGFPSSLCDWVSSFLSDRQVQLSFNGVKSDPIHLDHGTPQGSPLSPILSAIYTSPLLKLINDTWKRRGLNMYVDDGAIYGCNRTHDSSARLVQSGLEDIANWLSRNGLKCDPEKTEFISFAPRKASHLIGSPVSELRFHLPTGPLAVKRSELIRYLGVFIHFRFDWSHHVTIMANRARSTARALNILGNSIRGLDYANWRRVFHALILPVLTYGFQLYSTQPHNKGLLKTLQIAQNVMVRKMSGCFKTTPVVPLHYLMAIPPISHTLKKLTSVFILRIQRLPPFSLIRTITVTNPAADWHLTIQPETALTRLLPTSYPPFFFPSSPSQNLWTHPRVRDNTIIKLSCESEEDTRLLIASPPYDTFHLFIRVLTTPSPPFSAAFLLFRGQTLVHHGSTRDASRPHALFRALCGGLTYNTLSNHIRVFLPDLSLSNYIFHTHKHPFLFLSHLLYDRLSSFLSADPVHHADFFRYSVKWSGLPGSAALKALTEEEQRITFPLPPSPLLPPKARLLCDLREEFFHLACTERVWQSIIPPDGRPPPFYIGALSRKDRGTSSAAIQLSCGHAFTADYSDNIRINAGDNTLCPCNPTTSTPTSPSQGFNCLMEEFLASPRSHPAPPPVQRLSPRKRNTTQHVLFECPLHTSPRRRIFGRYPFDAYVFGTEDGGRKLGEFQRATNTLLRPLPPRPDPP